MRWIPFIALFYASCSTVTVCPPPETEIAAEPDSTADQDEEAKADDEIKNAADKGVEVAVKKDTVEDEAFADYASMRKRVGELFAEEQYEAAATVLKNHIDRFPEKTEANTYNLTLASLMQNREEEAIYWLEEGLRREIFFGKWAFEGEMWKPLKERARFKEFLEQNIALVQKAQAKAKMKLEVELPDGYDKKKRYPLFIALHGGGENLEDFKPNWTSPRLKKEFIVAYVQSSQVASMNGFHWQEDAITQKELKRAFAKIKRKSSIDPERVYIGGFSSGGYGSVLAVVSQVIPTRGFVLLCPELPADPTEEQIESLVKKQVKGTLLTTELDRRIERQKKFANHLNDKQVPVRFVVTPNIGHWYPENLPELIDEALNDLAPAE